MLSERLKKIKARVFDIEFHDPNIWYFSDINILNDENKDEPLVVRKGLSSKFLGENLPVIIKPDELIVGNPNMNSVGFGSVVPKYATPEEEAYGAKFKLNEKSIWGHHPPYWEKVLNVGFKGIMEEIETAVEKQYEAEETDMKAVAEYRAMLAGIEGVLAFAQRHAQEALKLSVAEKEPERRKELFQIYKNCSRVPYFPAQTLWEALQAYWFTYCLVNSGGEFVPLGRVDQNVYPFYKADIEAGRITKEEARDLLGSFLAKCNERVCTDTKKCENHYDFGVFSQGVPPEFANDMEETGGHESGSYDSRSLMWKDEDDPYSENNFNFGQSANDWLMNMVIGGLRPNGEDGTNEVSFELLKLRFEMDFVMPTLSARVSKKTPESFWMALSECLKHSQGEPAIYNDDLIIPGFVEIGVPIEDARNYTNDGCWECLIPGKSHFSYAHVQNLRCLEWVLTRGETLLTGEQEGIDTGELSGYQDFESFYQAYCKQVNSQIDLQVEKRLENLGLSCAVAPDPLMSSIFENCIQKGRDLTDRAIVPYTFHLVLITGLSDTVDSLAAIKKLVFDDHAATLEEFRDAVIHNWEGYEELLHKVRTQCPKYGNDDDYADEILLRVIRDFEDHITQWRTKQNEIMVPCGIGTFENYAALGWNLSASPDGRKAREALAPNYAPTPGMDIQGPTAVIKSATKPELLKYYCGCPLDISLNANDFQGEVGTMRMTGILKSFCELGGCIATITTCDIEELKDARLHPENHRNLMVRMGGLSAYFIAMSPAQQENIIQRFSKGALIK